jgi:hypothetical protein
MTAMRLGTDENIGAPAANDLTNRVIDRYRRQGVTSLPWQSNVLGIERHFSTAVQWHDRCSVGSLMALAFKVLDIVLF